MTRPAAKVASLAVGGRSRAAPLTASLAAAAAEVWRSGRLKPLRPLATPWLFEGVNEAELERRLLALHRKVEALLDDTLAIHPRVRDAARADLAAGRRLLFTRYDVICPPEAPLDFSLLEVQAGDPSAMGWSDHLSSAFAPHVAAHPKWLMPSHRAELGAPRSIAFVVVKDSIVEQDHLLLAEHYRAHGWQAQVVDPRELTFDGAALRARGTGVDVVFRDAIDELVEEPWTTGGEALLAAHAAGAVRVANPFAAAFADDKCLLERLSLADVAQVPTTRVLTAGLARQLEAERAQWVLKPADGYGGFGVVVGPFVPGGEWGEALGSALAGPRRWVAQRYVPLPRQTVAVLDDAGAAHEEERFVVHSLWVHGDRFAGAFMRASQHPVVNVHQGGGLAPVFFASR